MHIGSIIRAGRAGRGRTRRVGASRVDAEHDPRRGGSDRPLSNPVMLRRIGVVTVAERALPRQVAALVDTLRHSFADAALK
jgi:hypothetical protein